MTNSHVLRAGSFDAVEITFGDQDTAPIAPIRLGHDNILRRLLNESHENQFDYAILDLSTEPEFAGRYNFDLEPADGLVRVGDQVLFFGFPFGGSYMTSHAGYVSAEYREALAHVLQIDGSINPGNSGGPLLHVASGKVVGIVTRTQTGLEKDFDDLVEAIKENERVLSQQGQGRITIGGIDPVAATRVTMSILGRVARNLKRSANVGIGWALCSEHVLSTGQVRKSR